MILFIYLFILPHLVKKLIRLQYYFRFDAKNIKHPVNVTEQVILWSFTCLSPQWMSLFTFQAVCH